MKSDRIQIFREMLGGGRNRVENLAPAHNTANTAIELGGGGGGGQRIPPNFGGGGGGMDPWQTGVENRLNSLDTRVGKIEDRLGGVERSLATLTERVDHLPTSTKLYATAVGIVLALTAAITFGEKLQSLTGPPTESSAYVAPQSDEAANSN